MHCFNCGRPGHSRKACMQRPKCFKCGSEEHLMKSCKKKEFVRCDQSKEKGHTLNNCPLRRKKTCHGCGKSEHVWDSYNKKRRKNQNLSDRRDSEVKICQIWSEEEELTCNIKIEGEQFKALVDTGSKISVISSLELQRLKLTADRFIPTKVNAFQASGARMRLDWMLELKLTVGETESFHTMYVAPMLTHDVILGGDWLREKKAVLKFDPPIGQRHVGRRSTP